MRNHEIQVCVVTLASLLAFTQMATAQAANNASKTPQIQSAFSDKTATDSATPASVDKKGKKEKPVKTTPVFIEHGVLMVDGWAAKADLNYEINDIHYLYVWAPGMGTVVISNKQFPGATLEQNAFNGTTLTVKADNHEVQLICDHPMLGKKPEPAYVAVDKSYKPSSRYPEFGYGATSDAPYAWPGSLADAHPSRYAPPLPPALQPTIATKTTCSTMPDGLAGDCVTTALTMPPDKSSK
jgi:hypothetical protein